ncbi:hypothetical protein KIN20_013558 [Parelaphostrongylus tenuis]|uniref:Uncharacterized protein n=1 Tax=Parelaphostrongylus tenuis TaxID=148309 RepID=A0AAD5MWA2_PARTN|nr:hypothetical protein KIN20_013558 [Parelaphostrongylus tenuis]
MVIEAIFLVISGDSRAKDFPEMLSDWLHESVGGGDWTCALNHIVRAYRVTVNDDVAHFIEIL